MRTYFTRFITILILLLGVGGSAWGDTETYTFTSKSWAATNSGGTANWTSGKDGNALTSGRGIQVTASTSGANGTSPITFSDVSQVVVTYSTNASKGAGSIAVQIGSNTASSQTVTTTGGTSDRTLTYNFSPNQTGKVKVTVTCTTNSIYVKSVAITYAGSLTPSTFALSSSSSVTLNTVNTTSSTVTCTSNNTGTAMTGTSSNTSVATFTSTSNLTGTINAVGRGTCKITLNQAASSTIAAGGPVEINVTVKGPSDLSVTSPMNVSVGATASISKSTNSDGAMSYTSNNTSVATVNSSGVVTGVAVGTTTISVSQAEGSLNLASDTKTVTVNVAAAPAPTIYTKVTDASALEAGKKILIVYESGSKAFGVIDNSRGTIAAVTISSNQISLPANNSTVDELILGGTSGAWTLKSSLQSGSKYLSNTSSTNIVYSDTYGANNQKWDITILSGNASIENKANTGRYIRYTTNTDPASFRPYTSGQSKTFDVAIYMEAETGTAPTFTPSSISTQNLVVGETYQTSAISVNSGGALSAESADEDVATVSWNNSTKKATVTAVAEGETTIKIKATANGDYLAGELPFTVNVVAPTISLNKNSTSLEIGGTEVLTATTTNAGGATVNWSTSDGTKVSLSGSGNTRTITGETAGSSTITASITVNGYTYSAECTVTVSAPVPAGDGDYIKVTTEPSDWTGTYLIVYEDGSKAMNGGLTTLDSSNNSIGVTIDGDVISASDANDAASFNIASDGDGGWAILSRSGLYIGQTANDNGLRTSSEIISNGLSLSGTDAVISCGVTTLRYNYAIDQQRFRYYKTGQQPIALYKRKVALKSATIVSFGDTEKILAVGQHWTNSITTNNTTGTRTYSSSNPSIVSINSETGEVTAVAEGGPITITVNIAETTTHTACTATYAVTVATSNVRYYRPVTNKIELDAGIAAGKRFVIATPQDGTYYAMGAINGSKWAASVLVPTEEREVTYLKVDADLTGSVNEFTLTNHPNEEYSFRQSLDDAYPYLSHTYTDESTHKIYSSATNTDDNQKFYLNYINGAWAIVNKGTPNWYLQYNKTNPRFCCYINSQINPMIFMEGLAVASIGDDFAPDGVWTGEDGALSVTVTPVAGYSSEDYSVTWIASNTNITITDEETGTFTGETAGELDVTILVRPTTATTYSPIAKSFPMIVTGNITDRMVTLFHESFGDNPNDARDWDDSYSVKSGVEYVYSGVEGYTIVNAKQNIDSEGFKLSGLNQSTQGTDASIIIGPLNVSGYTNLKVDYQWKAGSVKGTYSTSLSYSTTGASGSFTEVTGTGTGTVGFTNRSYDLPAAAQVSTLYLKIAFNTSNTRAIIDEVNLSGFASTYGFKVYEGSSNYSMLLVPKISPEFPKLNNNAIAVVDGLTDGQKTAMPAAILNAPNVVVNGNAYHLKVQDKVDGLYSPFYAPELLTTASKVSYARTAKEWNSLCLPFSLPFEKVTALFGDGAEIYQLTAVDANCQVVFTKFESGTIPAGTPVLVKSVSTSWNATELAGPFNIKGDAPVTFTPVGNSTVGTAELLGSYKEIVPGTVDGSQLYKLMTTASGQCFGKLSSTGKVYPFRIYLKYTPPTAQSAPANLPVKIHVIEGTIGDLNKDKMATLSDLTRMINMVNGVEEKTNAADLDGDGDVNGVDVNRLAKILTKSK